VDLEEEGDSNLRSELDRGPEEEEVDEEEVDEEDPETTTVVEVFHRTHSMPNWIVINNNKDENTCK